MFISTSIRSGFLTLALVGWVSGFWWCRGRWEHGLWLQWVVLPVFALNADRIWSLWKEWLDLAPEAFRRNLWWFGFLTLWEWQFWVTGFRTGIWWGGAGSGKDFTLGLVLISSLVLLARDEKSLRFLWHGVATVGVIAIAISAVIFYSQYGVSEQRFRLVWRYGPGFNAVTTGLLVGFVIVVLSGSLVRHRAFPNWLRWLVLLLLGVALAATESRGALLAVLVATVALVVASRERQRVLLNGLCIALGLAVYWALAYQVGESGSELVARGSAGRLAVYQTYLSQLGLLDWLVGKGQVPSLPPEELGWLVHHPHNAYLGQLVGYGLLGLLGLLVILTTALWKVRRGPLLPLLLFGLTACLFDGGQMFSLLTIARWETLLVLIPLVVAVAVAEKGVPKQAS